MCTLGKKTRPRPSEKPALAAEITAEGLVMPRTPSLAIELYTNADEAVDQRFIRQMHEQDLTPVSTDDSLPRFTLVVGPSPFTMPRGWEFFLTSPYEGAGYISTTLYNAGYPVRIVDVRY